MWMLMKTYAKVSFVPENLQSNVNGGKGGKMKLYRQCSILVNGAGHCEHSKDGCAVSPFVMMTDVSLGLCGLG